MLTEQNLDQLIQYRSGSPVLSVYLNVDPSTISAENYKLHLRQMLKEFEACAPQDVEAVQRFIDHEYRSSGRALAIFSCAPDDFFQSFSFSVPIRNRSRLMDRPYVKPLVDLMDHYGNYGVVLVDKQGARLFHFHMGELQEQEGTVGEAVRRTKRGGGSQAAGRRGGIAGQTRYSEEVIARNLKETAAFTARFFRENRVRRVLIGGTEGNVAQFTAFLPKSIQSLAVGTFPMEMLASHDQVLEKTLEIAMQAKQEKETKLVEAMITAAAKGRQGVVRLDDTLSAVHAGQIQTLVVGEGYRAPGYRCHGCGYLTDQAIKICPFCGSEFERIEDAVEHAIRKVIADGGEVEFVRESEELDQVGNIGGLLRYV